MPRSMLILRTTIKRSLTQILTLSNSLKTSWVTPRRRTRRNRSKRWIRKRQINRLWSLYRRQARSLSNWPRRRWSITASWEHWRGLRKVSWTKIQSWRRLSGSMKLDCNSFSIWSERRQSSLINSNSMCMRFIRKQVYAISSWSVS